MWPQSGEITVFMRHLVFVTLYGWLSGMQGGIFLICLLLFSTCFGQLCAHHQEKLPYLCDTWYMSLYMDGCPVCRAEWIPPCIPDHLYRVTNTRCRIGIVFFPDDGHTVARNM